MNVFGLLFISLLFLISVFVGAYKGASKAFIYVFIPVIFLVPGTASVKIVQGIPKLTPALFALIPILVIYVVNQCQATRINFIDFLVFCFLGSTFLSNLINSDYWEAQHHLFDDIWSLFLPYIFAKNLIHPAGYSFSAGKCIVVMASILSVLGLLEFVTGKSLFVFIFWRLFPDQVVSTIASRIGFYRAAGSFGHPIMLGTVLGMSICINRWVQAMHYWKPQKFRNFENIKSRYFSIIIFIGALLTLSRGPWLGTFFGYLITGFYKVNSVKRSLVRLICVFVAALFSYKLFEWYTSVSIEEATILQQPIIYRQQLYDLYIDMISQKPVWGWGSYFPTVKGFESIDNGFIFQIMINGFVSLFIFLLILTSIMVRLFFAGLRPKATFDQKCLAYTLLGTFVVYLITFWTVALQTDVHCNCLLFTLLGWSEGVLAWKLKESKYVELRP